jgi:hypothetical protein
MLDFPGSPSVGQTFNSGTGAIYVWDGVAWSIATSQTATALSRNLIVNPTFAISQENGTTAGTTSGFYPADQWRMLIAGASFAVSANSSYPNSNPSGSPGRISLKTTTAKAALAAGDYAAFCTTLEGGRVYPLFYPGNAPLQAVLRFGFNGPAGTYSVAFRNVAAYTVCWTGQFTITAGQANIDTYQTLVIPPPPTGYAWGGGTAAQIEIWFTFAAGTTFVAPVNGWQAANFLAGPGQFNLLGTVNNQAQIWDVGLYADPQRTGLPPPFQVPDYAADLMECLRYFQFYDFQMAAYGIASNQMQIAKSYPVYMRVNPSVATFAAGSATNVQTATLSAGVRHAIMLVTPTATGMASYFNNIQALSARM